MNTNRSGRNGRIKASLSDYLRRITALILLTIIAGSHLTVPTAHAGLFDWFIRSADVTTAYVSEAFADTNVNEMFIPVSLSIMREAYPVGPAITGNAIIAGSGTGWESSPKVVRQKMMFSVSAYNSLPGQTDDSPFITASNTHVHAGTVATNVLPFGTLLKIPDQFGDRIFVVEDRMNSRYNDKAYMDVWMEHYSDAVGFGRRMTTIEVLW